jgi:hypothetical protein
MARLETAVAVLLLVVFAEDDTATALAGLSQAEFDELLVFILVAAHEKRGFFDFDRSLAPDLRLDVFRIPDARAVELFRFTIPEIEVLAEAFGLPAVVTTPERVRATRVEALCVLLRRLAYPNRLCDLRDLFGRSLAALCSLTLHLSGFLVDRFSAVIDFDEQRICGRVREFADAIHSAGAPLDCIWGFVDGTARPMSRPLRHQRIMYSGHKRQHVLKFQCVTTPDGLIAHTFGPIEGRRHDMFVLKKSALLDRLEAMEAMEGYCLYGDPGYCVSARLIAPFKGAALDQHQMEFNQRMSAVRVVVEWSFGNVLSLWAFLDFRKNLKLGLSPIGSFYKLGVFLTNCHTCLRRGNIVSSKFGLEPPTLQQYLRR